MKRRLITTCAVIGTALGLGCSAAYGASGPIRDAGDATAAKLTLSSTEHRESTIAVVRDAGDATAAKLRLQAKQAERSASITVVRDAGDATAASLAKQRRIR